MAVTVTTDDLASPGQRLGAVVVDGLLLGVPFGILTGVYYFDDPGFRIPLWSTLLYGGLSAAYETVGTAVWGQTVGKHVVGIRVCSGRDLGRPGWLRAVKRWLPFLVLGRAPVVGGVLTALIPLPLLWTDNRQGLHDKLADTLVLRDESVSWA